jgi:hypothetical protein
VTMFLGSLLERALGESRGITPRRSSRFEPDAEPMEPPVLESYEAAPAPQRGIAIAQPESPDPAVRSELVERLVIERTAEKPEAAAPLLRPAEIAIERPAAAPSRGFTVEREPKPEPHVHTREATPASALQPVRISAVPPMPIERHTETIVRETAETRIESRTIERRLESLGREIEHTKEVRTLVPAPAEQRRADVPDRRSAAAPRTGAVPAESARRTTLRPVTTEARVPVNAAPAVQVTIGRVEIRAITPPAASQKNGPREPRLNLEEYLSKRERA